MDGGLYDGLPVDRLPIDAVDIPDEAHLRRSDPYRGAVDIEPEHAVEAVFDPRRLVARDPKSRTGEVIRVVGYSPGMDRVLVVVRVPDARLFQDHTGSPGSAANCCASITPRRADPPSGD